MLNLKRISKYCHSICCNKRYLFNLLVISLVIFQFSCKNIGLQPENCKQYDLLKTQLMQGWNTWSTNSVLTQILLPQGIAVDWQLISENKADTLTTAFIANKYGKEVIVPGLHAFNGSYSELQLQWLGNCVMVYTASEGNNLVIKIVPVDTAKNEGSIRVIPCMQWNKQGSYENAANVVKLKADNIQLPVFVNNGNNIMAMGTIFSDISLAKPIVISVGKQFSDEEAQHLLNIRKDSLLKHYNRYGVNAEAVKAMQTILAWNLIYDPIENRLISPVSRCWNYGWEGYVLFEWDNYFAAYMYALDNKELAYASAIEITRSATDKGFVPNFAAPHNNKSFDRSEPPVGAIMVKEIYRKYPEKWFLQCVFDQLLKWNRWWAENRDDNGLLCWGSDNIKNRDNKDQFNNLQAAKFESGLDNSPMFDGVVFDTITHRMKQADVGLMSLYIADCRALSEIADVLGKTIEADELRQRAGLYSKNLERLWDETQGMYFNYKTDSQKFNYRTSPTNFYPLIACTPTAKMAQSMVNEHFYNPAEYWGEYIMPATPRNDSAFADNQYWRGRIWAPMNFLVYLGLQNYNLPQARRAMAEKSIKLLMKEWLEKGHVHENYNATNGEGCDVNSSDGFYHWGALLGMINVIEQGQMPRPMLPLK